MIKKGIILAGGTGTRLSPLTKSVNKQLLPIHDKPMIFYPLSLLIQSGIKDILIITKSEEQNNFKKIIGDGERWGVKIDFLTQDKPSGIAEALIIAENWLNRSSSLLILGDNLFFGLGLNVIIKKSIIQVSDSKAIHTHGQLKVKNKLKKIFFRNYYFNYEELYYFYKINFHQTKYDEIKKKIPKYLFKMIFNFFIIRPEKFVYYLAKFLAFNKFRKLIK